MADTTVARHQVHVDGVRVSWLDFGGSGPAALLLHGLSSHALGWAAWLETTSLRLHPIAPDLPGHGFSAESPRGHGPIELGRDAARFWRDLGLGPAIIIGSSWGGAAGLVMAAEAPELVSALVLVDPAYRVPHGARDQMRLQFSSTYEFPSLAAARSAWLLMQPGLAPEIVERYYSGNVVELPDGRVRFRWRPAVLLEAAEHLDDDLEAFARRVRAPTLVVQAGERFVFPDDAAAALTAAIPGSWMVTIEGARHLVHLSQPREFDAALEAFLREQGLL